ncbi:DUF4304 domain-containing protein [Fluviicola taffensis]|uniref:DUF4304 domain-containing protein n=1 Tax=Fluviicola taffensis (strain DSM 16823 / NCIMB 13979 / RW262) TaxID=755732 RepID=F2IIV5_FLUTR|nr:DUF4304 domain-containing protein [Fluviicola taffensis]AEA42812.1 hypothetical protein Fluta_0809 [Fluviicola taffensis DSM 16823]
MFKFFRSNKKSHNLPKRYWTFNELSEKERSEITSKILYHNIKSSEFKKSITKYLTPKLRELGFKGSGGNFKKTSGHYIHTIQLFGSKYGGEGYVEIGVHLDFLPDSIHQPIDYTKIKTIDCFTRHSLHLENGKQMVDYGANESETKESIELIYKMIIEDALPYFELFNDFPSPFDKISLSDLTTDNSEFDKYRLSGKTLLIARIKLWMGQKEEAAKISEYGKTQVNGRQGSGLIIYFDKIINGDENFYLNDQEKVIVQKEREKQPREKVHFLEELNRIESLR